ncbi:hypothetical protein [Paraburkholderia diazotrophica]|uniref:Uncharacterized protein n=1 Tax=Paraburkholderia diazotrophica TaxID=667676 RepID=A0A1H7CZ68_9BURK|nr:hypothetical protein [Paraburkholderia diazotrophica]SEJ91165.1 hypothetical protein SAMN05192539_102335 [Paraburkholderia diazotrophica]
MDSAEIELEIEELHREVGIALFPWTRESFTEDKIKRGETDMQEITREWLSWLRSVKSEKDRNTDVWRKMRNWD